MRRLALLTALALAACNDEPSFDERFDKADKQIRAKAAEIDRELQAPPGSGNPPPS